MWNRIFYNRVTLHLLLLVSLLLSIPSFAVAQFKPSPLSAPRTGFPLPSDPNVQLLRKMLHPNTDYVGEQTTELTEFGGRLSQQKVFGDSKARVRRDYLTPEGLQGDIMITLPNRYFYYHRRTNVLDVAFWPNEETGRQRKLMQMVMQGRVVVERVGNERVAGRDAVILQITPRQPSVQSRQVKFWIDPDTGILLKNEISNTKGLVSRSYFTNIVVGNGAIILPRLFEAPSFPKMLPNPLLPPQPQYRNLEEAQGKLPFQPLLPSTVPKGFQITGVWSILPARMAAQHPAIILRYGDGMESLTLFERLSPEPMKSMLDKPRPLRRGRSIVHWVLSAPEGKMVGLTYIGHLSPEQVDALIASVR